MCIYIYTHTLKCFCKFDFCTMFLKEFLIFLVKTNKQINNQPKK